MNRRVAIRMQAMGLIRKKQRSWFYRHLNDLLYVTERDYDEGSSYLRFIIRSVLLALAVFLAAALTIGNVPQQMSNNPFNPDVGSLTMESFNWQIPLVLCLIALFGPYIRLWVMFLKTKIQSSYDLLEGVSLMGKYASFAVDRALAQTASSLPEKNTVKRSFFGLAQVFSSYANEDELREEARRFSRLIGTTFSVQFVNDLMYAEKEGLHYMKNSLRDLAKAMETQRDAILETQANSRDAVQMSFWINGFVFILTAASLMFLLRPSIYLQLQLNTKVGLSFLTAIIVTGSISFIFSIFLTKPKLDY